MDQTTLFVVSRYSDFGCFATEDDVHAAASDPANVQQLLDATTDDITRELDFIAPWLIADPAFAVRYESLAMSFTEGSPFQTWALLHPAMDPVEREHFHLRYQHNAFDLYVRLQDLLCPDSADLMNAPSEEAYP
jgi:hypothetical protein